MVRGARAVDRPQGPGRTWPWDLTVMSMRRPAVGVDVLRLRPETTALLEVTTALPSESTRRVWAPVLPLATRTPCALGGHRIVGNSLTALCLGVELGRAAGRLSGRAQLIADNESRALGAYQSELEGGHGQAEHGAAEDEEENEEDDTADAVGALLYLLVDEFAHRRLDLDNRQRAVLVRVPVAQALGKLDDVCAHESMAGEGGLEVPRLAQRRAAVRELKGRGRLAWRQ